MYLAEIVLLPACLYAAIYDFLFYKIPNKLVIFILAAYILKAGFTIVMGASIDILTEPVLTFTIVLSVGFLLFAIKVLGAGDAKLLAVSSLWMSEINSIQFITLVVISGGILALIYITLKKPLAFIRKLMLSKIVAKYGEATFVSASGNVVPYAMAICAGVVWVLLNNR
jgi:prepilin peptidase CpaA